MRAPVIAILLVTASFVGCIGALEDEADLEENSEELENETTQTFVPPAPNKSFIGAIDPNHADHHLPQLHTNTSGLEKVAHTNFNGFYPPDYQGGWGEVDVHDGRDIAAVASVDGKLGATLVDISDPENPEPISYVSSTGADFDARITDGGDYLVLGCQVSSVFGAQRYVAGNCHGDTSPHAPEPDASHAVSVFDISDPEDPEPVASIGTQAAHNVWTATIDEEIYVFTNAVEILRFNPEDGSLEEVGNVQGTHDVTVKPHPITGDWLLYTGSPKDNSMAIYEINDPSQPSPVVKSMDDVVGWHEQTVSDTVIDGRVILVGGGENSLNAGDAGGDARQKLSIVDVTDPSNPEKLATWQLPIDFHPPYNNYRFSAHNVDITPHGQVLSAWYHGGVWVFDVSTQERQQAPETLGFYQPHETPALAAPHTIPVVDYYTVPTVWGPQWTDEGRMVVGDLYTGVYVLEPEWGLLPDAGAS